MTGYIRNNFQKILIDALIVWSLTFFAGFIIGFILAASGVKDPIIKTALIAISNIFWMTIGFFIVSNRNTEKYWLHLSSVAVLAWLTGFVNLLVGSSLITIILGIFLIFVCMFIGGGFRLLIRRIQRS